MIFMILLLPGILLFAVCLWSRLWNRRLRALVCMFESRYAGTCVHCKCEVMRSGARASLCLQSPCDMNAFVPPESLRSEIPDTVRLHVGPFACDAPTVRVQ